VTFAEAGLLLICASILSKNEPRVLIKKYNTKPSSDIDSDNSDIASIGDNNSLKGEQKFSRIFFTCPNITDLIFKFHVKC